jgi:hypothetical protein
MSDEIQKNNELTELRKNKDDFKKAINHFYGEICRIRKNEDRKYQFPITLDTCLDTINQCYNYIDILETLHSLDQDGFDDYEIDLQTATVFLTSIEQYSHELKPQDKPVEILTGNSAVSVTSPTPNDTKGKPKRSALKATHKKVEEPEIAAPPSEDAKITGVVNHQDVSKEELYQIKDLPPPFVNETPVIIGNSADAFNIEIVAGSPQEPAPVTEDKTEEQLDNKLSIVQPDEDNKINLQIVLDDDKKEEDSETEYIDNYPALTEDDFSEDDAKNIDDIELVNNENNEENKDIIELPEELTEYSIKSISRSKTNSFKAKLQKKDIDEKTISAINLFPYNENDENIRKEYLLSRNNMIASPHVSKAILLMSGYSIDISSFGNWNTLSLERTMRNNSYDFVDKELIILNAIYDRIVYFSYVKNKPTFEEWLATIKFPDYDILFYGLFDANYPGINYYKITCPYCGLEDIVVGKENKDLVVAIDNNHSADSLSELLTTKEMGKLDTSSHLPKWATTTRLRKMTPNTKTLFEYEVPTLLDYVRMLTTVRRISQRDNTPIDLSKILEPESEEYSRLLLYLYIKTVGLPSPIYGDKLRPKEPTSYKYIGLTNKADIIEIINSLDFDDYLSLLNGDPIKDLLLKKSVYYFIKDIQCTNKDCGKIIKYINLDPRKIFFSRITEAQTTLL